jgi:cyclopropane fatty-acyl-phospholipid synthase-like methyltransferase
LLNARTKIIQSLNLQGDEIVLDVACGRGLLLTEAVRTLPDLLPPSRLLTGTKPG